MIVYHRWENQTGDGPYRGSRRVAIDRINYDPDGLLRPVLMTGGAAGSTAGATAIPIAVEPVP